MTSVVVGDIDTMAGTAALPAMGDVFAAQLAPLCRLAAVLVGDRDVAEEVVMEAFASSVPRWPRIAAMERPDAYLRRAVVNICCSQVRRFAAERRAHARARATAEAPVWDGEVSATARVVLDAVRSLPPRQRACIVLRYFDDLPEAEIAAVLGCSVGTVKSQLAKARRHLAALLADEEA